MSDRVLAAPRATVSEAMAGVLLAGPAVLALAVLLLAPTAALLLASLTDMELGGPNNASEVLLHLMYREGFTYFRIGYSAAITAVFLVVVLALVVVQTRVLERRVHYA